MSCSPLRQTIAHQNDTESINVLATVFSPFTYFEENRGFVDGIDLLLLNAVTRRLGMKLNLHKIDHINGVHVDDLK